MGHLPVEMPLTIAPMLQPKASRELYLPDSAAATARSYG
jgi:hypothetical protein